MSDTYTVRLLPVDVEFEVEEGETVLNAAFRQGIALPHGCKEGQCSACKSVLVDGEVDLLKYSTFALNDMERESGHVLLCRSLPQSDIEVELLNFDEELLSKAIAVRSFTGTIIRFEKLTHDIRGIEIEIDQPIKFWAGQYVDITVTTQAGETITRSFSMANPPSETKKLYFIIKKYPDGKFSGQLDNGGIALGAKVKLVGPYGTCFRREDRDGALILVAAGSACRRSGRSFTTTLPAASSGRSTSSTVLGPRATCSTWSGSRRWSANGQRSPSSRCCRTRRRMPTGTASAASFTSGSAPGSRSLVSTAQVMSTLAGRRR